MQFARNILLSYEFLTRMHRNSCILGLHFLVAPKNPAKFPPNFPQDLQKEFTDELGKSCFSQSNFGAMKCLEIVFSRPQNWSQLQNPTTKARLPPSRFLCVIPWEGMQQNLVLTFMAKKGLACVLFSALHQFQIEEHQQDKHF